MRFQSVLKFVALASAVAFATGAAADGMPRGSLKDPIPAPFSWTGLYMGVSAGAAWTSQKVDNQLFALASPNLESTGFAYGSVAGYNWQSGSTVYGLEADFSGVGAQRGSTVMSAGTRFSTSATAG